MRLYIKLFVIVCLAISASVVFAEESAGSPQADDVNKAGVPAFPYMAQITGDDVIIRSGPGTNYYACGKLNKTDKVKIVASQYSWSQIVPPAGSFSWISMQYIRIDSNNSSTGTVNADAVRVYAGSDQRKPIHSTTMQGKLDKGEKVHLLGEELEGYYKISPPPFAYLWVLTQYTIPADAVAHAPATPVPAGESNVIEPNAAIAAQPTASVTDANADVQKPKKEPNTPAVVPTKLPVENPAEVKKIEDYKALEKQFDAERAKPMAEQNYENIKKGFLEIAGDKEAGRAARYAELKLKQLERCEMAIQIAKEVRMQDANLQKIKAEIEKARAEKVSQIKDKSKYAAIGKLQPSDIFGPSVELKQYRLVDDANNTICYAAPANAISNNDFSKFLGQKVGLTGTIEPHPQIPGALVRFNEIVEIK
ncbi:MAG: hypothetical protein NTW55_07940 [Planctomycetota bacterium]|nr:hypothetical protein [Planctomycetota bacterium]